MGKNDIVAGIRLDGEKQFKEGVASVNKSLAAMKSEMTLLKSEYAGQENSLEALSKKHELLNRTLQEQKKKVDATKAALNHAEESYDNVGKGLENLWIDLEKATDKMQELENIYGSSSKEALEQRKVVQQLSSAIEKGEANWKRAGDRIEDWKTKLNAAEAQVLQANTALNKNAAYMKEAEEAADHCATSINKFGKEIAKVETNTFADDLKANLVSSGIEKGAELLADTFGKVKDSMYDISKASASFAAQTGLTGSALEKYKDVMLEIRGNNFGEDYADVSSVMAEIVQIMGELDPSNMQATTESAIALRDTFGMDVNEQIRAVDVMMKTLGVDATQAFNLITTGAQRGLNRSGELVDNITEYGQLWGQAGFSAEEMFAIMENGLDDGAYNLDKVNTYIQEFGNALADGRIKKNIGSFSDGTQELFEAWEKGEASTKDVFYSVIRDLESMENQQAALTLASETWSSAGEDNAMQVITALNNVNTAYSNVKGAAESLKEVSYSDLESSVTGFGAAIQENILTPIGEKALPLIQGAFETATGIINGISEAITPQKTVLDTFIEEIKTSNEEVSSLIENAQATMTGAEGDVANLEAYRNTLLELNSETEKTEFQKYQLKTIVGELAGSVPELAAAFDEETGSLALTNEELVKMFEAQKNLILQQAAMTAQEDSYTALYTAKLNEAKAISAIEAAEEDLAELRAKNEQSLLDDPNAGWGYGEYYNDILDLEVAVDDLRKEQEKASEAAREAEEEYNLTAAAVEKANAEMENLTVSTEENTTQSKEAASAQGDLGTALTETGQAIQANAEAQKNASKAILEAYHGYVDEIKADLQDKISLFDKFDTSDGGEDMTVEDMTANLDSQIAAFEEYQENLAAVKDHVGKEIAPEFMQYLEGMGMEGANTLKHILATFEDNEPDKVKEMSDKWVEAMNMSEGMAEVGAANKLAYEAAMGELGSTDAEFSELSSAIENSISGELKTALENAVKTAQDMGIKIPEGLTEGIASRDVSAEDAIAQLAGSMQGAFEGLAEVAKEAGLSGVDELAAGITSGETTVQEAYQALIASLSAHTADLETTGTETGSNAGDNIVSGLEGKTEDVSSAMDAVAQAGADAASNKATSYYESGTKSAAEYLRGIQEAQAKATVAGNALATAVKTAISSQTGFFSVGNNISASVALGIQYGSSGAINAARNMAANALAAAKAELQIASPSKRFRKEVGQNISESTAFGIKDKATLAGRAAKRMSNKVYTNAVSWLSAYKKKQQVSLADEKWYWQQVLEHTKKGTTAYNKALKKIQNITVSELTASGLSSSVATKITDNFGVSKKTGSGKKKKNKDTETYYSEVYSAAQKYLSNQQVLNDWSLDQELTYWNAVKGQLKKGTQAWYDAQKQINGLQADIAEAEARAAEEKLRTHADVQDDILDKYKTYYKVSAKAEADYWNIARKQFKTGTDERIEADQKYYDALQEFYDQRQELDEEYAENSKDINDELIENIQDLQDAYHDAVQSRKEDILSSMNLFESWDATGYDADTLLHNLQTQVAGLALWEQQLEELGKKGLTDGLMEELSRMGPDAAANIYSLNQMTAEQLKEYNKLWEQKGALAESQAVKDNADLLKETNSEISQLRKDAQSELDLLNAEYKAALQELNTGISGDLKNLINKAGSIGEDAVSSLIAGIGKAATAVDTYSSTTKVVNSISGQLGVLSDAGKTIGENTLQSILDQLTDTEKINTAAKSAAQSIASAMQEELLLRQEAMNELNSIGNGGVVMLNNLAKSAYSSQQTIVNVDNNGILSVLQQMFSGLQVMTEEIKNLQMVIYPDVVAGQMQTAMDKANADAAILKNRGRY